MTARVEDKEILQGVSLDIKKGETFTEDNIVPRHAGRGISPAKWNDVLGKVAIRDFIEDEMIEL